VHGVGVVDADDDSVPTWEDPDSVTPEGDALVTTVPGRALAVLVADCAPVAITAPGVVAVAHAGWRGLVGGVLEATVAAVRARTAGGEASPHALLGPCIGPCCFEVGEEVADQFDDAHVVRRAGAPRPFVDMRAAVAARLAAVGVSCEIDERCTSCDASLFSHRRDRGTTGRQAVVAWID
jgi:YfiH family protein